jgi:hypothetical protein
MTSRKMARFVGFLVLWSLLPVPTIDRGYAQQVDSPAVADSADAIPATAPTIDESVPAGGLVQGLPQRAPQPRTLHDFWPAFAGLAVLWVVMVAYVLGFGGSLRRIAAGMQSADRGGTRE